MRRAEAYLSEILDVLKGMDIVTYKRGGEVAVTHNEGEGTAVSFPTPFETDEITIPSARCFDSVRRPVNFRIPPASINRSGFTCIPDIDCTLSYSATIK